MPFLNYYLLMLAKILNWCSLINYVRDILFKAHELYYLLEISLELLYSIVLKKMIFYLGIVDN